LNHRNLYEKYFTADIGRKIPLVGPTYSIANKVLNLWNPQEDTV